MEFTMNEASDTQGIVEFLLGGSAVGVTLDDVKLVRLTDIGIGGLPLEEQFPLKNGDFSDGKTGWSEHVEGVHGDSSSSAEFSVADEVMTIDIADIGNESHHVMLMQNDFPLRRGHTYVVKADAKSSVARDMEFVIDNATYHRHLSERVSLTTEWQTFSYELTPTDDWTVSFKLLLGALEGMDDPGTHSVRVDNVRVEEVGAREKAFPLQNGSFDDGMTGWSEHVQGRYDGWDKETVVEAVYGTATAKIANVGLFPWDIMLFQDGLPIQEGVDYVVSFEADSSVARPIEVTAENGGYHRYLNQPLTLDTETQSYRFEFKATANDTVALKFLLGKPNGEGVPAPPVPHEIRIDNVRFEIKGAKEATGEK
ncbi:carbohydrate binding domain-containing protein [Paenibacillaceae bacterium WGS1546]|uniref:carbohydrate binding domain-containing protein n=1 Tax=Cohnella sp. WGS1546 TaxID=3366810 RepID=UPI00372D4528